MNRDELKGLLYEIGLSGGKRGELKDSGDNIQFNCPFHGETRPSAGIHVYDEVGRCFSCGETFTLTKLVAHCKGWTNNFRDRDGNSYENYNYNKAEEWLEEKYNIEKKVITKESMGIMRIEDDLDEEPVDVNKRHEMSKLKLAVFKSGKVVHDYFLERGFTKETAKKFLVGWDAKRMRITMPVLWEDGTPCGVIGRAVLEMKINGERNPEFYKIYKQGNDFKYHIYDNFPVGDIIYPLPYFKPVDDMAILVEGQCFRGDTEILTKNGWVRFDEYENDEVMQVDNNMEGSFVKPNAVIKKKFDGNLYHVERGGNYETLTTPDHNLVYFNKRGELIKRRAEDMPTNIQGKVPTVVNYSGAGLGLTRAQITLCIAVSADATIDIRKDSGYHKSKRPREKRYARFGFTKERKITRLIELLDKLALDYSISKHKSGQTSICFPLPNWSIGRIFPNDWVYKSTLDEKKFILSEMVYWDGNFVKGRNQTEYVSKYYDNVKFMQTIAHTCGIMSTIYKKEDELGVRYKASILHGKSSVSWQGIKPNEVPYNGLVYCVTVPTGMILVRQNGKIHVTGNCDAIWGHEQGFPQFASTLGSKLTYNRRLGRCKQIEILHKYGVKKVLLLRDLDEAGRKGSEHDYKLLRQEGIVVYGTDYPEGKTDPQELTAEEIQLMIDNKYLFNVGTSKLKRIDD